MSRILAIVIATTIGVVACDDKNSAPAGDKPTEPAASADAKEKPAKAGTATPSANAEGDKAGTEKGSPGKEVDKAATAEPAADAAAPAADGEAFGVAACDDYAAKVAACATFDRKSKIYTMLTEQWRKDIAAGKQADAEAKCTKAAGMFRCPKA